MQHKSNDHIIEGIFPIGLYRAHKSSLDPTDEAELEDLIKKRKKDYSRGFKITEDKYIFETKLANLKEFCEKHIKIYVKEVLGNLDQGLTFYITQSWLVITKPGGDVNVHWHSNSIISGVFYISVKEDDHICFYDPLKKHRKPYILINRDEYGVWYSDIFRANVNNNELILFPPWLEHGFTSNEKNTTDRISLSFNVFVKGSIGIQGTTNELVLR